MKWHHHSIRVTDTEFRPNLSSRLTDFQLFTNCYHNSQPPFASVTACCIKVTRLCFQTVNAAVVRRRTARTDENIKIVQEFAIMRQGPTEMCRRI